MLRKCIIVLVLGLLLAAPVSARKYKGDDTMLVSPYVFFTGFKGISLTIHTEIDFSEVVRESVVLTGAGMEAIEPYLGGPERAALLERRRLLVELIDGARPAGDRLRVTPRLIFATSVLPI